MIHELIGLKNNAVDLSGDILLKCWMTWALFEFAQSKTYLNCLVLCIFTSFWVLRAPESWLQHFFWPFSTFLFISNIFQWFVAEIKKKRLKKFEKTYLRKLTYLTLGLI